MYGLSYAQLHITLIVWIINDAKMLQTTSHVPSLAFTGLASFPEIKAEAHRGGRGRWTEGSGRGRGKKTCTQNRLKKHYSTCNKPTCFNNA